MYLFSDKSLVYTKLRINIKPRCFLHNLIWFLGRSIWSLTHYSLMTPYGDIYLGEHR